MLVLERTLEGTRSYLQWRVAYPVEFMNFEGTAIEKRMVCAPHLGSNIHSIEMDECSTNSNAKKHTRYMVLELRSFRPTQNDSLCKITFWPIVQKWRPLCCPITCPESKSTRGPGLGSRNLSMNRLKFRFPMKHIPMDWFQFSKLGFQIIIAFEFHSKTAYFALRTNAVETKITSKFTHLLFWKRIDGKKRPLQSFLGNVR